MAPETSAGPAPPNRATTTIVPTKTMAEVVVPKGRNRNDMPRANAGATMATA